MSQRSEKLSLSGVSAVSSASARSDLSSISAISSDGCPSTWMAIFDYEAVREDELSFKKGTQIQVLSRDARISGDEGWWTGEINLKVGIFPSAYVANQVLLNFFIIFGQL